MPHTLSINISVSAASSSSIIAFGAPHPSKTVVMSNSALAVVIVAALAATGSTNPYCMHNMNSNGKVKFVVTYLTGRKISFTPNKMFKKRTKSRN